MLSAGRIPGARCRASRRFRPRSAPGCDFGGLGIVIGLAASFALTRGLSSILFGVSATDPLTFTAVAILLLFVGLLVCYLPARRAMRTDPLATLRYE